MALLAYVFGAIEADSGEPIRLALQDRHRAALGFAAGTLCFVVGAMALGLLLGAKHQRVEPWSLALHAVGGAICGLVVSPVGKVREDADERRAGPRRARLLFAILVVGLYYLTQG